MVSTVLLRMIKRPETEMTRGNEHRFCVPKFSGFQRTILRRIVSSVTGGRWMIGHELWVRAYWRCVGGVSVWVPMPTLYSVKCQGAPHGKHCQLAPEPVPVYGGGGGAVGPFRTQAPRRKGGTHTDPPPPYMWGVGPHIPTEMTPGPKIGKVKMVFLESARRGDSETPSFALHLVNKNLNHF